MRKIILIAAVTLAMGGAAQAQAGWGASITTHGMGVSTTLDGNILPGGALGIVVHD